MTVETRIIKIDNDSLRRLEGSFNRVALAITELNQTIKEASAVQTIQNFVTPSMPEILTELGKALKDKDPDGSS